MSLLDFFGSGPDDPRSGQILGLAQGLLSAPGGRGLAAGIQGMSDARQMTLREKLAQMQIAEQGAQTQERLARTSQIQAAQEAQARKLAAVPGLFGAGGQGPAQSSGGPAGLAPAAMSASGGGPRIDFMRALQAGYSPKEIAEMAELPNAGRPTVARTMEVRDPKTGRPKLIQADQFGNVVGEGMEQWKAPISTNQGDRTTFLDPATMQQIGSLQTFQSPDSKASSALGWANNAATLRGQNLTDSRARETLAQGKMQYDADRGVVVDLRTGMSTPATQGGVPLGSKEKPLNDTQAKALQFSSRMEASDRIMAELSAKGAVNTIPGSTTPIIGRAITAFGGAENQQLEQAQRDFVNAVLRRESGAAIADHEFENAKKQYFPQFGDSKEVIAQKGRSRALSIAGIKAEVPKGAPNIADFMPERAAPAGPKTPMRGQVLQGYKFKGGDPADQSNWEKQ